MRNLRLIPLLVMAFAAPAAADDHRVDFSLGPRYSTGSYLFGGRAAVGVPVGRTKVDGRGHVTQPHSLVGEYAFANGTDDVGYEERRAFAVGWRYTLPVSGPNHKLHGYVQYGNTFKARDSGDKGSVVLFSVGWEFVPDPGNGKSHGLGLGAQFDAAVGQVPQAQLSIGLVYRVGHK
jgi:hypothetical protein